jgi:hypothetical protein
MYKRKFTATWEDILAVHMGTMHARVNYNNIDFKMSRK